MKQRGFALATTLVMLTISLISMTTMVLVLSRSLRLTRSHSEALSAFYVSEAGKSYAMWKLSSNNDGADAVQLAHCLVQDSECPGGLSENWNYTIPGDSNASFDVSVVSGEGPGAADVSSYGNRVEGAGTARRRTKITAFKATRTLEENDQVYDYAISADDDIWTVNNGDLSVTSQEDEPTKAGIHANDTISQGIYSRIFVDGPAKATGVISMPPSSSTNTFTATQYRGASCGFSGCSSLYSGEPTYCFGTNCEGYIGHFPMPGFDVNSAEPDSFKTIAQEYEAQNPGQRYFYNNSEIEQELENARETGVNDGWFTATGPLTYVNGDLRLVYGDKLRVPGVLVVQGKLTVGVLDNSQSSCVYPTTCQPDTYLEINQENAVTGLIVTNDITFTLYTKEANINGLTYTSKNFNATCLFEPLTLTGVIVAKNYINSDANCNPNLAEPMHQQIYDTAKLHILTQGPRSINNVTTVYSGHWEEEY